MKTDARKAVLTLIASILLLFLQACAHPMFYRAKEFSGTVVDAEMNKPIEGVVVVAQWIPFQANFASGGHKGVMKVYEAVTDKDGKYRIPGWGPRMRPITSYLDHYDPQIFVFKRGYKYLRLVNSEPEEFYKYYGKEKLDKLDFETFERRVSDTAFDSKKSLRESVWDGRVIKMKRFEGDNEKLDMMLSDVYRDILNKEEMGIPIRKVKYTAKEWSAALKDVKKPFLYATPPPHIEKVIKEEFK